ncbi:hypothetical protein [Winogradskyella sp.]|uniref:hypothetical protein n=1 Tax=Winogradskyella sp. TaxID=1883156 RepID=UPI003F6D55F7
MKDLKNQMEELSSNPLLSKTFRNKKLLQYVIRTLIAVIIIYFLWDYSWVKWVLYIYIPLNLISLFSILGWNKFLNKRIKKSQQHIEDIIISIDEEE